MRIIYLTIAKFNKRDYFRFGVDFFKEKGINIEVWNISQLLFTDYHNTYVPPDTLEYEHCIEFSSYDQLNNELKKLTKKDFLIDFNAQYLKDGFLNVSDTTNVYKVVINFKPSDEDSLWRALIKKSILQILQFVLIGKLFMIFNHGKKRYNGVILGGFLSYSFLRIKEFQYPYKLIKTHALDYDLYLSLQKSVLTLETKKYCVFLDEAVVNHPDFKSFGLFGSMKLCETDIYYKELNLFLDYVESKYKVKVIISSHPRVSYAGSNVFLNREVMYGSSNELIRNAQFVIGHTSNSMHYAILYNKGLIFLDSTNYDQKFRNIIQQKASLLESQVVNLSGFSRNLQINFNTKQYLRFMKNYIKESSSSHVPSWEILYNEFFKILNNIG